MSALWKNFKKDGVIREVDRTTIPQYLLNLEHINARFLKLIPQRNIDNDLVGYYNNNTGPHGKQWMKKTFFI